MDADGRRRARPFAQARQLKGGALYGFAAGPVVSGRRVFAADLNGQIYAFGLPRR
ncbi:MAG: PQQ-binding-like beta-propeller repeat protein [Hyphomonadaceae bacterium]|nr:PQQ-binding-like beta-propeller repeat protein [Hyphomonadaceae bacterium]